MSNGFCGLHGLSTKKSAMTKLKARHHVNLMSNLIQHMLWPMEHGMVYMAAHGYVVTWLGCLNIPI